MGFATFMASSTGRWLRMIAGLVLIALGFGVMAGTGGILVALVGLVPLLAGLFDVCLFAPLVGAPFRGEAIRQHARG